MKRMDWDLARGNPVGETLAGWMWLLSRLQSGPSALEMTEIQRSDAVQTSEEIERRIHGLLYPKGQWQTVASMSKGLPNSGTVNLLLGRNAIPFGIRFSSPPDAVWTTAVQIFADENSTLDTFDMGILNGLDGSTQESLEGLFQSAKALRHIKLDMNHSGSNGDLFFAALKQSRNIKTLVLERFDLTGPHMARFLAALENMPLEMLTLRMCKMRGVDMISFVKALQRSAVVTLKFQFNEIGPSEYQTLFRGLPQSKLQRLFVSAGGPAGLGWRGFRALAQALPESALTHLELDRVRGLRNWFGLQNYKMIFQQVPRSRLKVLELCTGDFSDAEIEALAGAVRQSSLEELKLIGAGYVDDRSLAPIARVLHLSQLRKAEFVRVPWDRAFYDELIRSIPGSHLEDLELRDVDISDQDHEQLLRAMVDAPIHRYANWNWDSRPGGPFPNALLDDLTRLIERGTMTHLKIQEPDPAALGNARVEAEWALRIRRLREVIKSHSVVLE